LNRYGRAPAAMAGLRRALGRIAVANAVPTPWGVAPTRTHGGASIPLQELAGGPAPACKKLQGRADAGSEA
jgi:hypothetical protein